MGFGNSFLRRSTSQFLSLLFLVLLIVFTALKSKYPSQIAFLVLVVVFVCFLAAAILYPVIAKGVEQHHERRPQRVESVDAASESFSGQDAEFLHLVSDLTTKCQYRDLEIATAGFSVELGRGGFGTVYEGKLENGTKIAVKKLIQRATDEGKREFYAEVATIARIHHVNLVQLLGFCAEAGNRALVYELVENGSLDKWIFAKREPRFLNWKKRFNVCLDTARGLAYLHGDCRERILHLDVKPPNILLDKDFTAKVADFGLARAIGRNESRLWTTAIRGTPGYIAPEWLTAEGVTSKTDVYSYGVVMLEVVSGRRCVDRAAEISGDWFLPAVAMRKVREGRVAELIDTAALEEGSGGAADRETAERALRVACWCMQGNPAARPSMAAVVRMLEGVLKVAEPPTSTAAFSFFDIFYGDVPQPERRPISSDSLSQTQVSTLRLPPPFPVEEIAELSWTCGHCTHLNGVYLAICRHCGHSSRPPLSPT